MIGLIRDKCIKSSIKLDAVSNILTFETTTCAVARHASRKIEKNFIVSLFIYVCNI